MSKDTLYTSEESFTLRTTHTHRVHSLTLSDTLNRVASADDGGRMVVWDVRDLTPDAKCVLNLHENEVRVLHILLSQDGQRLYACFSDGTVRAWSLENSGVGHGNLNARLIRMLGAP